MSRRPPFTFVDASPAHSQREKELIKSQASAHAARESHIRRKRALYSKLRSPKHRRMVPPTEMFDLQSSMNIHQQLLQLNDSQPANLSLTLPICEACGYRMTLVHNPDDDSRFQLSCRCDRQADLENFRAMFNYPAHRPDWTQEDVVDLQFFIEILGTSVQNYSDSGFFNIVVPCLSDFNVGIRNLVLAVASTYRNILTPKEVDSHATNIKALERCNKAITSLSKQSAVTPPEVLQTSCILLACWYMLRLDPKAAATCTRAAEKLCHMDREMTLNCRIVSARNATDPQETSNYRQSTFASIIAGTVAKRLLESLIDFDALMTGQDAFSVQLNLSSQGLRHQIRDIHDLLSSVESLAPFYQQLRANTTFQARIDQDSSLAQDLLARIDQIAIKLRKAPAYSERIVTAIDTLWCWNYLYSIGVHCQVLSSSEMSWDEYTFEFAVLIECAERHLAQGGLQGDSPFVFLPVGIIVQPLWFTAVHCRDPAIRRRAIAVLLKHHRNEAGLDSWYAGQVALELMRLEERKRDVRSASDIRDSDRILLRGFNYVDDQLYLLFVYATEVGMPDAIALRRHPFSIPEDPHGVVQLRKPNKEVEHLHILLLLVRQATPEAAPRGYFVPMYYDGEFVEVVVPANRDQ